MNKQYLLDTSAIVTLSRNKTGSVAINLINSGSIKHCAISDLTLYEMYAGAYDSKKQEESTAYVEHLASWLEVIPSSSACKEAANQKLRLKKEGRQIEDIDNLIGRTAIVSGRILVTGNVKHMSRLQGIQIENWLE